MRYCFVTVVVVMSVFGTARAANVAQASGKAPATTTTTTATEKTTEDKRATTSAEDDDIALKLDLAADESFRRCQGLVSEDRTALARACFESVLEESPDSTAALKAKAALSTLDARIQVERSTRGEPSRWPFKPGRLELSLAGGAFGIYTGVAVGGLLGSNPAIVHPVASATGGALAMGLGGAFVVGSYALGEFFELRPGTSRLVASGMGWGTLFGLALAPWVFTLMGTPWPPGAFVPNLSTWQQTVPAVLAVSAGLGWLGLGLSSGFALVSNLDADQVAVMNTGALMGVLLGATFYPLLGAGNVGHPVWLGVLTMTTGALGLAGGWGMANLIDLETWEVVVVDSIALATFALVGGGAVLGSMALGGSNIGANVVLGGVTGVATTTALIASTATLAFFRVQRGDMFSRVGFLPVDAIFAPSVSLDRHNNPAMGATFAFSF